MSIKNILEKYKSGHLSIEEAVKKLSYEDIGHTKVDHHRKTRTGYPEIIYGDGKTPLQAAEIFQTLVKDNEAVICTRASKDIAKSIERICPQAVYFETAKLVIYNNKPKNKVGLVAIATGGTSDMPVAEEAALILETFGSNVLRLYDVGVAGVHRLFSHQSELRKATCVIAIAGMEGALPSVVSGLVATPVIAVPTSIGYGANFSGVTPLLAMLCSCAAGVSVVNIDNGFGAAYIADIINKQSVKVF